MFLGGAPTSTSGFFRTYVRTYVRTSQMFVPNVRPKLIFYVRPKIPYCLSYLYGVTYGKQDWSDR